MVKLSWHQAFDLLFVLSFKVSQPGHVELVEFEPVDVELLQHVELEGVEVVQHCGSAASAYATTGHDVPYLHNVSYWISRSKLIQRSDVASFIQSCYIMNILLTTCNGISHLPWSRAEHELT